MYHRSAAPVRVRFGAGYNSGGLCQPAPTATSPPPPGAGWGAPAMAVPVLRARDPAALHTLAGETMGTTWSVRLANPAFAPLEPVQQAVQAALDRVVQQMSHWDAASDLSCFNSAAAGSWHTLAPEFAQVMACAMHWWQASGGAWDPTVGPLVQAWGFGPASRSRAASGEEWLPPSPHVLQAALGRVGFDRLQLRVAERQMLQPGGVQLDLSGIAKGFGVDEVARTLQALGFSAFLVEVGGELRAHGQRPDGHPWRVQVAAVPGHTGAPLVLRLQEMAVATSGDHWHAFEHEGRRYSHTLDPRTAEPVAHALSSVTVLHPDCMQADALATVLTVLGPREGLAFAQDHGIAALLCERTAHGPLLHASAAWAQKD